MNPIDTFPTQETDSGSDSSPTGDNSSPDVQASTTAKKIRRTAGQAADRAKEKVAQVATDQKDAAADKIGGYGSRLRDTARSAEAEDPNIAHLANQAADRLESVADYVRRADFNQLKEDAAGVARRHPALFLGGMLVVGLMTGNIAKAAVQSLQETVTDDGEDFTDHYPDGNDFPEQSDGQTTVMATTTTSLSPATPATSASAWAKIPGWPA